MLRNAPTWYCVARGESSSGLGLGYSHPRFKDTLLESTPRLKDTKKCSKQGGPQIYKIEGDVLFMMRDLIFFLLDFQREDNAK